MIKWIIIVFAFCLLGLFYQSEAIFLGEIDDSTGFTFRGTCWGMSQEQVKAIETAEFSSEGTQNNLLFFKYQLLDEQVTILYEFDHENRLFRAGYIFNDNYRERGEVEEDFYTLFNFLTEKYGEHSVHSSDENNNEVLWELGNENYIYLVFTSENLENVLTIKFFNLNMLKEYENIKIE
ncbi:MAG: hypothetical protein ACP5FK_10270 [bacterium]